MSADTLVIANPASGGGSSPERLARLEEQLRVRLGALEFVQTDGRGAARELAVKGARAEVSRIVVAGGDGTFGEVVDGLLSAGVGDSVAVGLLPLGRGCDFARTLGVGRDLDRAIDALADGRERLLDAGRIEVGTKIGEIGEIGEIGDEIRDAGAPRGSDEPNTPRAEFTGVRHFANVASGGISADVVHCMNRPSVFGASLGPTPAFGIAALRAIAAHRPAHVRVVADGKVAHEGPIALVAIGNGRYFGAGMSVAPAAKPDDGLFEVVTIDAMPRPQLIANFLSIYRGTHVKRPYVHVRRAAEVAIEVERGELALEADGEELGAAPARFTLLRGAIRFFGVPA